MLHLTVHLMQGWTALHDAAMCGGMLAVELLLAKGADVHANSNEVTSTC